MIVNGRERDFPPGITIEELIEKLGVSKNFSVVIVDGKVIDRENFNKKLNSDSEVKILTIIGGG